MHATKGTTNALGNSGTSRFLACLLTRLFDLVYSDHTLIYQKEERNGELKVRR